jgi:hypothetical protein
MPCPQLRFNQNRLFHIPHCCIFFFRYYGSYNFTIPSLILKDPELVKQITVKDFDHFVDHNTFLSEEVDPLWGKNLFALTGNEISN